MSIEEKSLPQPSANTTLTEIAGKDKEMYEDPEEMNFEYNESGTFSSLDLRYGELAPYAYQRSIFEEI